MYELVHVLKGMEIVCFSCREYVSVEGFVYYSLSVWRRPGSSSAEIGSTVCPLQAKA